MIPKHIILSDKYLMEGLRRELSVMQKLKGNNVVRLLDTLESSNNYYII
jgi:serine/threonine protein kinase